MESVNDYLNSLEPSYRARVEELRALIARTVPDAVERFSYGVIMYKTEYDLVGIGVAKGVISLYAMGVAAEPRFAKRLGDFKIKGKTLHLPVNGNWDETLLADLILARAEANRTRFINKSRQKPKKA